MGLCQAGEPQSMRPSLARSWLLCISLLGLAGCVEDTPIGMLSASTSQGEDSATTGSNTDAAATDTVATDATATSTVTTGSLTTGASTTDTTATDTNATDTSTTGADIFGSCDDADPDLDAAYQVSFGPWDDPQLAELDEELHNVTISDTCTISSVAVELGDVITSLSCTQGEVDVTIVAPRSGEVAWSTGDSVTFDFRDAAEDISVSTRIEKYVAVRRDDRPLFVGVSADDDPFGELLDPVSVSYDGELCGGDVVAEDAGMLVFDAPEGGQTSIYDRHRGSVVLEADLILDIDVAEAHRGPCCHLIDTFDYLARAAVKP